MITTCVPPNMSAALSFVCMQVEMREYVEFESRPAGTWVARRGDPMSCLYYIREGECELWHGGAYARSELNDSDLEEEVDEVSCQSLLGIRGHCSLAANEGVSWMSWVEMCLYPITPPNSCILSIVLRRPLHTATRPCRPGLNKYLEITGRNAYTGRAGRER